MVETRRTRQLALAPLRREILLMVKAGAPVDTMRARLALLSPGDSWLDGGNSFFEDARRCEAATRERGVLGGTGVAARSDHLVGAMIVTVAVIALAAGGRVT